MLVKISSGNEGQKVYVMYVNAMPVLGMTGN